MLWIFFPLFAIKFGCFLVSSTIYYFTNTQAFATKKTENGEKTKVGRIDSRTGIFFYKLTQKI
jgi:hypothetical protein